MWDKSEICMLVLTLCKAMKFGLHIVLDPKEGGVPSTAAYASLYNTLITSFVVWHVFNKRKIVYVHIVDAR